MWSNHSRESVKLKIVFWSHGILVIFVLLLIILKIIYWASIKFTFHYFEKTSPNHGKLKKKKRRRNIFSCSQNIGTITFDFWVYRWLVFLCTIFGMYVFSAYIKYMSIITVNVSQVSWVRDQSRFIGFEAHTTEECLFGRKNLKLPRWN